jgi:adenylate kinase family enzyme
VRKVLVIGNGGAGKSTFAIRLGAITRTPVIHLDAHYWGPGWTAKPPEQWKALVKELLDRESWIMDGNYNGTMAERMAAADTVLYFDMPRLTCLAGVLARRFSHNRADRIPGCRDKVDLEFVKWIWTYPRKVRPRVMQLLHDRCASKDVVVFHSRREADAYLKRQGVIPS